MAKVAAQREDQLEVLSVPVEIASYSSSPNLPQFKTKPKAKPLDHHLSVESRRIGASEFKQLAALEESHRIIRLGAGRPNPALYPWTFTLLDLSPTAKSIEAAEGQNPAAKHHFDVASALNYGKALGSPQLLQFLTEHVEMVHEPPYSDWNVCITGGSTHAIEVALRIFCDVGDTVLVEQYTYPGFLDMATLVGVEVQATAMDSEGLRSDALDKILSEWDCSRGRKPRVLYMIPSGQNPTGSTQSSERRKDIYALAEKHDLVIIEDDPYSYLNLDLSNSADLNGHTKNPILDDSKSSYRSSLPQSYLSLDTSGRVVRLDSTSKILCPGLRAGWVTASAQIIDKLVAYQGTDAITASGPSQLMLSQLLINSWGHHGFFFWLAHLSATYRRRRDIVERALERYIPEQSAHWVSPQFGMFLWLRLGFGVNSGAECQVGDEGFRNEASSLEGRILARALENGVQVTAGSIFAVSPMPAGEVCVRITYAAAAEEELEEGVRRLADAIKKELAIERH